MNKNVIKDAQEVKRRLAFIGRNDVDDSVIYDLLNSYNSDSALDSVMDIILSTSNDNNTESQTTAVNAEISDTSKIAIVKTEEEIKKDNSMMDDYVDLSLSVDNTIEIDDSSDSDEADDTYYNNGNWDDISYLDNISQSLSPVLMNVCEDIETPTEIPNDLANTADNEILEENNNDPNNNMESIEDHVEEPTCSSNIEGEPYTENTVIRAYSPQPGCSSNIENEAYTENTLVQAFSPQPGCSSNIENEAFTESTSIQAFSPQPGCSSNMENEAYTESNTIQAFSPQPGCSSNMENEAYTESSTIQPFSPQPGCSSNIESEAYVANTSIEAYSPQPGCSSHIEREACTESMPIRAYSPQPGCSSNTIREACVENTLIQAYSPQPGCSSNMEMEVCMDNTLIQADSPQHGCNSNIESGTCMESNTLMEVDSSQPGCIKDTDMGKRIDYRKLRREAQKIFEVLPNLDYVLIHNTLLKNQSAENRIELTIWDLLPDKRPQPQYSLKRKYVDDDCIIEESNVSSNTCKDNSTNNQNSITTSCIQPRKENFKKLFNPFNSTSKSNLFSTQNKSDLDIWNNSIKHGSDMKEGGNMKSVLTPVSSSLSSKSPQLKNQELMSAECSSSVFKEVSCISKPNILRQPILNVVTRNNTNQQATSKVTNPQLIFNVTNRSNMNQIYKNSYKTVLTKQNNFKELANIARSETTSGPPPKNLVIRPSRLVYTASLQQPISNSVSPTTVLSNPQILPNKSCIIRVAGAATKGTNPIQLTPITPANNMIFNLNNKSYRIVPVGAKKKDVESSVIHIPECSATPSTSSASYQTLPSTTTREESHPTSSSSVSTSTSKDLSSMAPTTSTHVTPILPSREGVSSVKNSDEVSSCVTSHSLDKTKEDFHTAQKIHKPLDPRFALIFSKLMSMFPQVDADYVRQICIADLQNERQTNDIDRMINLTEHLLQREATTPSVKENKVPEEVAMEEQCTNLIGIFPDADPTYLRQTAQQLYNKPEELRQFIQSKLENPNYPTREQYYAKRKITEQQKQYTTDFKVEQFLEIFPRPFEYFEDRNRQCIFSSDALEFLKFHFNRIKVATLMSYYSQKKYHLSLTAKAVEVLRPDVKSKRTRVPYTPQNIPLLQEIAFIVHKEEIRKYLKEATLREFDEFLEYKRNNALLQCQCCYDDECMPSKCSSCENGHMFCNSCIIRGTEAKLADGQTRINCFTDCTSELSLSTLQRILSPTKFSIILRKRQEEEVMAAGLEGLVSCPFCHFASIPPPEDKIFKCLNPECMKETCRLCKELNHVPLKCEEAKSDKARLYLEEKMTEALVRKCYRCGRPFFKEDGCNKIYCVCGAMMCYICDKPIKGYEHFNQGNQPQSNLCPLWSDNRSINAAAVVKVAEETMKHMQEKDPSVKLNTKGLLPRVPAKKNGHVEPGFNSTTLPVRAYKIARFDS